MRPSHDALGDRTDHQVLQSGATVGTHDVHEDSSVSRRRANRVSPHGERVEGPQELRWCRCFMQAMRSAPRMGYAGLPIEHPDPHRFGEVGRRSRAMIW
jgi:hypothetical protein